MTYTPDTPIIGPATGTLAEALAWLDIKAGAETEYATELWRLATMVGIDPAVMFAQAAHETGDFSSYWWQYRRNPAGIGITGDKKQNEASQTWANGVDAARAHVAHMVAYVFARKWNVTILAYLSSLPTYDDRWDDVFDAGYAGTARTLSDLTGKWATDPKYHEKVAAKANSIFPNRPQEVIPSMAQFTTTIPGLPGGPLVTDYPISLMIIPESQKINRPGTKARLPREGVQHGAGNPNSFARGDAIWAFNGAKNDRGEPTQTSFHATADEFGVTVTVPADEVTWQAADGGGPGNMNGFSCEMSENAVYRQDMTRLRKNIYVNADFMGRVAARLNIAKPKQHWDFNFNSADRHNCPNILRTMSIGGVPCWTIYTTQWNASKADEVKRMSGTPDPKPERKPYPITWEAGDVGPQKLNNYPALAYLFELTAKKAATRRCGASSDSPTFGEKLVPGKKYITIGGVDVPTASGRLQPWVILDDLARVPMSMFDEKLPRP